jgi:hypothetical protein
LENVVNESLALHTAARRYCLERHAYWCERYSAIVRERGDRQADGYQYTPEALATFPRYNVLNAIRVEVERLDPGKLGDPDSTRALVVLAGELAEDDFTRSPIGDVDKKAMANEREAFCRYMMTLTVFNLSAVEELPYRRVLAEEESKSVWSRLRGRWQIPDGYWYPLSDCQPSDVVAFQTAACDESDAYRKLQDILAARGIERIWELREYGPEYEEDLTLFQPHYDLAEGYWSSGDLDWIVYASHESSVTVGGWLLRDLKALWPEWEAHIWAGLPD